MKKCKKWECLLDRFRIPFWTPFWEVLGYLWGALGRHFVKKWGSGRRPKNDAKNRSASNLERDPVRPYKQSFLEPRGFDFFDSSSPGDSISSILWFFESMLDYYVDYYYVNYLITMVASLHSTSCFASSGTVADVRPIKGSRYVKVQCVGAWLEVVDGSVLSCLGIMNAGGSYKD